MATEKTVNYTPEQTVQIVAAYAAGSTVADLATQFSKSVRSITAKLSREGVYQKKAYVSKSGTAPVKKDALADRLSVMFNLTEPEAESLTKANKTALLKILQKFEE